MVLSALPLRNTGLLRSALLACGIAVSATSAVEAQAPTAFCYRDLRFGTVMAGFPETVPRTDAGRIGRCLILGTRNAEILIVMTLPTDLVDLGGNVLPISFGTDDGGYSNTPNLGTMTGWDPATPLITRLSNFFFIGLKYIVLGGTVSPAPNQPPGNYQALVVMTVSYTGN